MNKDFCIASLTHDAEGRAEALYLTYLSFYNNTNWEGGLQVKLFLNGVNEKLGEAIRKIENLNTKEKYFDLEVIFSDENLGCSTGLNMINNITYVQNYKYVLFLEGDWICLQNDKNWLNDSLQYLEEHTDIDLIYLRIFESSYKVRHHGSTWAFEPNTLVKDTFRPIYDVRYTNNPCIRRNYEFYEKGILPLNEYTGETHDSPDWGKAENDAEYSTQGVINAVYYKFGIFIHYDSPNLFDNNGNFKCPEPMFCPYLDKCKYGFIRDNEPIFCVGCNPLNNDTYEMIDERYIHHHDILNAKNNKIKLVK